MIDPKSRRFCLFLSRTAVNNKIGRKRLIIAREAHKHKVIASTIATSRRITPRDAYVNVTPSFEGLLAEEKRIVFAQKFKDLSSCHQTDESVVGNSAFACDHPSQQEKTRRTTCHNGSLGDLAAMSTAHGIFGSFWPRRDLVSLLFCRVLSTNGIVWIIFAIFTLIPLVLIS